MIMISQRHRERRTEFFICLFWETASKYYRLFHIQNMADKMTRRGKHNLFAGGGDKIIKSGYKGTVSSDMKHVI